MASCVTNVSRTLDVSMAPATSRGIASARKAGEDCSVTKVSCLHILFIPPLFLFLSKTNISLDIDMYM